MNKAFFQLEDFGRAFVPERWRPRLASYLRKAGIKKVNYSFFGLLFFIGIAVTLVPYAVWVFPWLSGLSTDPTLSALYVGLGTFLSIFLGALLVSGIIMMCVYLYLDVRIYRRTKEVERVFPDFLQFFASNLKAGMSFDRALWKSVRPQFGVIADDIDIVAKKVTTGQDVEEALLEFADKYRSPIIRRSVDLIVEGMRGGGQMVYIIDKIIDNLNEAQNLRDEMKASVTAYVIFITLIVLVVAPGLFALSNQLLHLVQGFAARLGTATTQSSIDLPFTFTNIAVDPEEFQQFAYIALGIISFFASMILSLINRGDVRGGLKWIPLFVIISYLVFGFFLQFLSQLFGFIG